MFVTAPGFTHAAFGQNPQPYYLTGGTYALALDTDPGTNLHRIATFLPSHTPIFKEEQIPVNGQPYVTVFTQHGQRLLVSAKFISPKSFVDKYRPKTIIYHENSYICPSENTSCDASTGLEIGKGDVLRRLPGDNSDLVHLSHTDVDGSIVDGVLHDDAYERLLSSGIITDAARPYPRYKVERVTPFNSLSTVCGEQREKVDLKELKAEAKVSIGIGDLLRRLTGLFDLNLDLSHLWEKSETVKSAYGHEHAALTFEKIDIDVVDPDFRGDPPQASRSFYITAEQVCSGVGPKAPRIYVNSVHIKEENGVERVRTFHKFYPKLRPDDRIPESIDEDSPQYKVYQWNGGHSYLTSINSPPEYERVFEIWQKQIEDPSLAAIFMGLFNSSCPDKKQSGLNLRQECNRVLSPRGGSGSQPGS
jgi:hypothetical protein